MSHRVREQASGTGQAAEDRGEKRTFAMVFLEAGKARLGRVISSELACLSNSGGLYVIGVVPRCLVPGPWIWNPDLR